jgi:hypothetical protein
MIFLNSLILAFADYSQVDLNGDLDTSESIRNTIVVYADGIFTTFFLIECTMKIIAMGLIGEKGAYLMDPWNWLDFIVVFIGILAVIPGIPNVSALRTFRVLRPLRSVNAVAGMKKLVNALLKSIPELLTVVAFLFFLFFLYGAIGVQLWSGILHPRCRLTPYPLRLEPNLTMETLPAYIDHAISNQKDFYCSTDAKNNSNLNAIPIPLDMHNWTHDTSLWNTPKICFWPIAQVEEDGSPSLKKTCALTEDPTMYRQCPRGQVCGSDYDSYGNFRFFHPDPLIDKIFLRAGATFNAEMNWGFVNFDHIGTASLTIFQCITREGWSDIMYMLQDAGYGVVAVFYFVSFIIFGSFFMLNLTLAVIWENFAEASLIDKKKKESRYRFISKSTSFKTTSSFISRVPSYLCELDHS